MKKHLLLTTAFSLFLGLGASAQTAYIAEELDGKALSLRCNSGSTGHGDYLSINGTSLKCVSAPGAHPYIWDAEYDETEQGITLKSGDYYLGRMPLETGGLFKLTMNKEEAGRYRFYTANDDKLALTCTRFEDGSIISTIETTGSASNADAIHWLQYKANQEPCRWASMAGTSKWAYTIIEDDIYHDNMFLLGSAKAANQTGNHVYIGDNILKLDTNHNASAVWRLSRSVNGNYYFYNIATQRWLDNWVSTSHTYGEFSTTDDINEAAEYAIEAQTDGVSGGVSITDVVNSKNFNSQSGTVRHYSIDAGSCWLLTPYSADMHPQWITAAQNSYNSMSNHEFGNEPGKYTETPEGILARLEELVGMFNSDNTIEVLTALSEFETTAPLANISIFNINALEYPALVTWQYNASWGNEKYVTTIPNNIVENLKTLKVSSINDPHSFILEGGNGTTNRLYGYDNGLGVILESGEVPSGQKIGLYMYDGDDITENIASEIRFGTTAANGTYSMKNDQGYNIGGSSSPSKRVMIWSDHSEKPGAAYGNIISYVPEIEIEVAGQKLYRTPVAVELINNDDISVYVITVSGDVITTIPVNMTENTVFAAGTGFIFYGNGTQSLTVHNGEAGDATYVNNIGGHHKLHTYTPAEGNLALMIASDEDLAATPAVFTADHTTTIAMKVVSGVSTMQPHDAAIELANHENINVNDIINLALDGSTSTGIRNIIASERTENTAIYDLQGRKLKKATHGLNIIGGKKVFVK